MHLLGAIRMHDQKCVSAYPSELGETRAHGAIAKRECRPPLSVHPIKSGPPYVTAFRRWGVGTLD